jgi:hypothetical protein
MLFAAVAWLPEEQDRDEFGDDDASHAQAGFGQVQHEQRPERLHSVMDAATYARTG